MYKKITHTIVEEHFDCPESVDVSSAVESKMSTKFRITPTAPIISESAFKANVEDAVLDVNLRWLNLLNAMYDKSIDYENAVSNAYTNIDTLGNTLRGYYGAEFAERFNQVLRASITNLMYTWRNESNGWDNSQQKARLFEMLTPGAMILFTQFNQLWLSDDVERIFNELYNTYINLGTAYKTKNTNLQSELETQLATIWNQLATLISSGVIQQFPAYFTA